MVTRCKKSCYHGDDYNDLDCSLVIITDVADWARDADREDHSVATGILSTVPLLPYMEADHSGFSTDFVHSKGFVCIEISSTPINQGSLIPWVFLIEERAW